MQYTAALSRQPNLAARQRILVLCGRIKKVKQEKMAAARAKDGEESFRKSYVEVRGYYKFAMRLGNITSRIGQSGAKEDFDEVMKDLGESMRDLRAL